MRPPKSLVVLTALATALAGCSGGGGDEKDDEVDGAFQTFGPQATKDTGVIRGVVVDAAIMPVAGATVLVRGAQMEPQETVTNDDGLFAFGGLAPGEYFLTVEKPGYFAASIDAVVVAGVSDPAAKRVLLEADPETRPYVQAHSFSGFIECSVRVRDPTGVTSVVFGEPYYHGDNTCGRTAAAGISNQVTNFPLQFDMAPSHVQGELTWRSTQATGSGLTLVLGPESCVDIKWGRNDGTSPLVTTMNETVVQQNVEDGSDAGACFRVFTWSAPEAADAAGASVNQEFDLIVHVFYNLTPPEGWSFGADGAPQA